MKFRTWLSFLTCLSRKLLRKASKSLSMNMNSFQSSRDILSELRTKVLVFVEKRTHCLSIFCSSSQSSFLVPSGDVDQHSFDMTYMDKCSSSSIFVSNKLYVSSVFFELNSPIGMYGVLKSGRLRSP